MDLGGELKILEPSLILQVADMASLTGEMKFITRQNEARLNFVNGALIFATIESRKKRIGESLVEKGYINESQLNSALEEYKSREDRIRLGNILIERGYIKHDVLVSNIKDQMKEVVYQVLDWKEGRFVFYNGLQPEDEDILLDIKLDHLILEGLRRLDESNLPPRK
jgi:hypothetical protein